MKVIDADRLPFMRSDLTGVIESNPDPNYNLWERGYQACLSEVQRQIRSAPVVGYVQHGLWENVRMFTTGDGRVKVGECPFCKSTERVRHHCPNCGAKLDAE